MPNFKLKYEDSENMTADRVNIVVFNLHQIKRRAFFLGHMTPDTILYHQRNSQNACPDKIKKVTREEKSLDYT